MVCVGFFCQCAIEVCEKKRGRMKISAYTHRNINVHCANSSINGLRRVIEKRNCYMLLATISCLSCETKQAVSRLNP